MSYVINSSIRAKYYGTTNRGNPKYIVLHYTGNEGTTATAKGNANYFHTCPVKASAHYVVDENETVYQCVPDNYPAWSVGDSSNGHGTLYGKCTNTNSISIEMVSHSSNGVYYIPEVTINRAVELTRDLMKKYNIDIDHVCRHYDVTTKRCPEPMCGTTAKNAVWTALKKTIASGVTVSVTPMSKTMQVLSDDGTLNVRSNPNTSASILGVLNNGTTVTITGKSGSWYQIKYNNSTGYVYGAYLTEVAENEKNNNAEEDDDMTYYKTINDVPSWYKPAIQKLVDNKFMVGDGNGVLNVSEDLCRMATVLNNAGILDLVAPVVYKNLEDIPSWYQGSVKKLVDCGAIAGTGNGELNMSEDLCRSLTIMDNAGFIDAIIGAKEE